MIFLLLIFLRDVYPVYEKFIPGTPPMKTFTKKDFSYISSIWAIQQDKRGVMYFGSAFGLVEYDGAEWRLLALPNSSMVRSLAEGKDGRLYIGGNGQIGYLGRNPDGSMKYISLKEQLPEEDRSFADIWKICVTSKGI